jgi:predicted short-subunit dehydrogenase-like oxidoreductase (DUF2520 family)
MRELERETTRNRRASALAIVGPGRVGRSISRGLLAAGREHRLYGRGDDLDPGAEIVLLCVPDVEIPAACERLAAAGAPRFVGHTSGATGLSGLEAAAGRGAATFSLHPLMTVPDGETPLAGAPCAVAADAEEALAVARDLALALGMRAFEVPEESRAAYHAAACMASNFLVALEESAVELLDRAGVDNGRELLSALVLRSAANWSERGGAALTGPIARGDDATVARHLDALAEAHPELLDVYRALAERTRALAGASEGTAR